MVEAQPVNAALTLSYEHLRAGQRMVEDLRARLEREGAPAHVLEELAVIDLQLERCRKQLFGEIEDMPWRR